MLHYSAGYFQSLSWYYYFVFLIHFLFRTHSQTHISVSFHNFATKKRKQSSVSSFCVLTNAQRVSNNHQLTLDLWLLTYRLPGRMWWLKHSLVENDFCRQNKQPEARNVNRYCSWTCQHKKYGFTTLDCIMLFISSRYSVDLIESMLQMLENTLLWL